jgi:ATP-dependent Clp protease protease subunit
MDAETWMSAHKAIELKFADKILYEATPMDMVDHGFIFDQLTVTNTLLKKLPGIKARMLEQTGSKGADEPVDNKQPNDSTPEQPANEADLNQVPVSQLEKRLNLIKNWR